MSRRIAINAIAPVWDANQVWLIIGGGALFAGFPVMYATMLSAITSKISLLFLFIQDFQWKSGARRSAIKQQTSYPKDEITNVTCNSII